MELVNTGEIDERIESLFDILTNCDLCPRECEINRVQGKTGYCKADANMMVSMIQPHFWEETPLVGLGGSGAVFFNTL
jgi:putative pyruvate formate lyase activating enzyme